jgi:hypothetical protein
MALMAFAEKESQRWRNGKLHAWSNLKHANQSLCSKL